MSTPTHTVAIDDTLEHVQSRMHDTGVSCLAVVDPDGGLAGVVSRSDLLRVGARADGDRRALVLPDRRVHEVMTENAVSVPINTPMRDAAQVMVERDVHRVFVTSPAGIVGVVSTKEAMRALGDLGVAAPLSDFMSSPVRTVPAQESLGAATAILEDSGLHGLVVMEMNLPIGVFAQLDALEARGRPAEDRVDQVMNARILCLEKDTPIHRAAVQAEATRVRRVLCMDGKTLVGILTGIDFARALSQATS